MILEAMYRGEFYPSETVVPKSPEYRKANQACGKLMEELANRLSKEDYALVGELHEQQLIAQSEENKEHSSMGFPWDCWFSRRPLNRPTEKHGRTCYKAAGKNGSAAAPGSSSGDTGCYVVPAALCILDL